MRKQLLADFVPDDVCLLAAQFVEQSGQLSSLASKIDAESQEEVVQYPFRVTITRMS